jgi:hypothetical protein
MRPRPTRLAAAATGPARRRTARYRTSTATTPSTPGEARSPMCAIRRAGPTAPGSKRRRAVVEHDRSGGVERAEHEVVPASRHAAYRRRLVAVDHVVVTTSHCSQG